MLGQVWNLGRIPAKISRKKHLGSMEVLAAQIIALVLIVVVSFVVGGAPIALGHRFGLTTGEAEIGNRRARVLAFLMNFGGGVLVGLSLCHWLPETRESKMHTDKSGWPKIPLRLSDCFHAWQPSVNFLSLVPGF